MGEAKLRGVQNAMVKGSFCIILVSMANVMVACKISSCMHLVCCVYFCC